MRIKVLLGQLCIAAALTMSLASCATDKQQQRAVAALCKDPHNTGGGGGVQPCTAQSHCGVCGTGWQCWNAAGGDTNCHTHAPGTPWSGPP